MSDKQKAMRARLNELMKENAEIQDRRHENDKELLKDPETGAQRFDFSVSRVFRRMGSAGMPRSVIYSQKMKIPKGRK